MSEMLDETCSCGATFHFEGSGASMDASRWRREHRHEPGNHAAMLECLEAQVYGDDGFISRMVDAEAAAADARAALSGSNTRSAALGDAETLQGAQKAVPEFACIGCAFCTGTMKQDSDESEGDRG